MFPGPHRALWNQSYQRERDNVHNVNMYTLPFHHIAVTHTHTSHSLADGVQVMQGRSRDRQFQHTLLVKYISGPGNIPINWCQTQGNGITWTGLTVNLHSSAVGETHWRYWHALKMSGGSEHGRHIDYRCWCNTKTQCKPYAHARTHVPFYAHANKHTYNT